MTRAKSRLIMTYATWRRMYYQEKRRASRFIREMPKECVLRHGSSQRVYAADCVEPVDDGEVVREAVCEEGLVIGQKVRHPKFGVGKIIQCEGHGESARIAVKFELAGLKWLVAKFAKLESVSY